MEDRAVRHNFERNPPRVGLIWFSGFRGEDLNVKAYDVRRTPSDGKKWLSPTTCHFENIWWKSKSCGHAHLHYVYKHPVKYESCSSKTVGGVSRTNHLPFMQLLWKKWLSPTTCHFENIWGVSGTNYAY